MIEGMKRIALGVSLGFAGGAILGVILGLLTKDFAVWLAVCVGCGIAIGAGIGAYLENIGNHGKAGNERMSGYVMAITGFIMLVINAISYLFRLDFRAPALTVMGIVFVVIGMGTVRNSRK
jgi:hypothetical protein